MSGPLSIRGAESGTVIEWPSWAQWRRGQADPSRVWVSLGGSLCATCWGQKRILEPGPLGLLPVLCDDCDGTGLAEPVVVARAA